MSKIRADQLAVKQGLCESRALAQRLIEAGQIHLPDGTPLRKVGQPLDSETVLVLEAPPKYVSRGAEKLLGGMAAFHPPIENAIALDLGASTGGFTDVLLQHGAKRVYAVDVGHGQLHEKLRNDPRVISLEGVNARELDEKIIPEKINLLVGDVSFISLTLVLPPCAPLLAPGAWVVVLVKPQFEAGRDAIASQGVVRDENVRKACVEKILLFAKEHLHWSPLGAVPSPILGPNGNQEFLAAFRTRM
ncbi:MAG: TlyA family RNA methyltransferase [Lentisphaeria bacterium]|nr:TlyA family RNA methyltransferase [Lentisphaeria bacterium]